MDNVARLIAIALLLFISVSADAARFGGSISIVAPSSISARVTGSEFQALLQRPLNMGVGASGVFATLINNNPVSFFGIRGIGNSAIVSLATRGAMMIGPGALVFTLVDLFWDDLTKTWKKLDIDKTYAQGKWCNGSWANCSSSPSGACILSPVSGFKFDSLIKVDDSRFSCLRQSLSDSNYKTVLGGAYLVYACPPKTVYEQGVCIDAKYVSASESDVQTQVSAFVNGSSANALQEAQRLAALPSNVAGIDQLLSLAGPVSSTSGPSTLPATTSTSTSTGPDGQTQKTVVSEPHVSYSNTSNVITITVTETTTIVNPSGQTTTTTTTETSTKPIDPELTTPKDQQNDDLCSKYPNSAMCQPPVDLCKEYPDSALCKPAKDFCEEHPDAISCMELGEPLPSDSENQEKTITWNKEMSDVGQCPQDIEFNILGKSYSLSWLPVCRLATGLRPFIIISAWLSAGIFLFGIVARSD
ncbi:MAG: virulence factor TspB C-terminal domain-related protein [Nitrosomonas ureae]